MELRTVQQVTSMFDEISRYGNLKDHAVLTSNTEHGENGDKTRLTLKIYTNTNSYQISAVLPYEGKEGGYLGCIASTRKPRAGEDWTRGSDLPDGPLSEDTWNRILRSIVSYEMVRIARTAERIHGVPEEA